ncbi:uncharacterized protein LOC128895911 isoform X2 [Hylaeus anthracinus]|uniref:uncharacterized protein LOC128895911 isoform X2 n=1 Tax=Hylaeus anthracinus TaxID=313031 RepID=UPI0023B89942|nr:uncharacterized protein LOC128895911 isoform X2 [Hylaeus anthracinus]
MFERDIIQKERNVWNLVQNQCGLNNESYRNALQAFIDRRRISSVEADAPCSPDKSKPDLLWPKINNNKCDNNRKAQESQSILPGVPHIPASEIFEIGWVPGTEDRYLELIFAEWQNTRVSLKRHTHPECKDAVKADLDVLSEIQHPNVLLLMATIHTDDHGLISIFESIDCTLYHYIHDQGERISIQGIAKCGGRLSDALRHTHMRGYVHTAISSHCVYLASSGMIKLGGWELAKHIGSPKQDRKYEERLRAEIFRWQAPELFHSYEPRKESDVYGLAMLIWEMCTMNVPWSGYSRADVDRHYTHWKRGVVTDSYDFPPLLNNLLEAGLQLDVTKRTLDMNRMRRFLQRLEMQYEDEEPVYVDQYANNNNESGKTYVLPATKHSVVMSKSKDSKLAKSASMKQLYPSKTSDSPAKQYLHSRKTVSKQNASSKTPTHTKQANLFVDDMKRTPKDDLQKGANIVCGTQNNYRNGSYSNCDLETTDILREKDFEDTSDTLQPWQCAYKKVRGPGELVDSRTVSIYSSPLPDSTDDESFKDARTNLEQLKKALANKREHFFYGSDSSSNSADSSQETKNIIFAQVKSKDYEPHKPASHKTSLEPKFNKSPGQYDPSCMKSSFQQYRKIPYLHTPESIKDAIAQPQVLNSDPQSFFETSLWRKEKLICLAKMRKSYGDESVHSNDTICNGTLSENETSETNSPKNATETETSQDELTEIPLQKDIKDALDRATKILLSATPKTDDVRSTSSFETYSDFDVMLDDSQACKNIFEETYNLRMNDDNEEIKCIERSTKRNEMNLFGKNDTIDKTAETNKSFLFNENDMIEKRTNINEPQHDNDISISVASYENPSDSYDATYSRNFVCESIAEVSSEFLNVSYTDSKLNKTTELYSNSETTVEKQEKKPLEDVQHISATIEERDNDVRIQINDNEKKSETTNLNFMFLTDTSKTKNCKSCCPSDLPRRRSLPAALSQLKLLNNSTLGKLPIRRGDVPDNTVEDLYIDDEFGDSLNVNMVLLDEDLLYDDDFLPDLLEI